MDSVAHKESITIPAHHTIWNGYNKRELRIEFTIPTKGTNNETGLFILVPGFGEHIDSAEYKNMRSQFADLYNVVTLQCDYFGSRFMQGVTDFTFNNAASFLATFFDEEEAIQIQHDSSKLLPLLEDKNVEFPIYAKLNENIDEFADMSYMQAIDLITAIEAVKTILTENDFQYNDKRIIGYGQSHGAYLLHLSNRLVPHLFSHIIDVGAGVAPIYFDHIRALYVPYHQAILCAEFHYIARDIIQDQEALSLQQLYENFDNGSYIYSSVDVTDNLVNAEEKKASLSKLQHVQFEIIDSTKVDSVVAPTSQEPVNLVKSVLKTQLEHTNTKGQQLYYEVISANTKIRVDYRNGLPLFQLEGGNEDLLVKENDLAKQTKRNTDKLKDFSLHSRNVIAELKQNQPKIEYLETKTGVPTVVLGGYLLHSKYDPEKEATKIAEKEIEEEYLHVLFGYGCGYLAKALKDKLKDEPLLVYEPANSGIEQMMEIDDVIVVSDKKILQEQVRAYQGVYDTNMKLICSPNYDKLFPMEHRSVNLIVKERYLAEQAHRATVKFFGDVWQENIRNNLLYLDGAGSVQDLHKKYIQPVVVASGGPSLTKQLPLLKEIANKVIIIAAGSTIKSLLAAGIEPDYVVTIDGAVINYDLHFKNLEVGKTKLITALSSHHKITEKYQNNLYVYGMAIEDTILDYCKEKLKIDIPIMLNGGSCAHTAMHIATYISSGPVALIGQDLAYTNNQSHAAGNAGYSDLDANWLENNYAFEVESYDGGRVYTDLTFNAMREQFEEIYGILKENSTIYNCTEGGSKIVGMPQKAFQAFCQEFVDELPVREPFVDDQEKQTVTLPQLQQFFDEELVVYRQIEHLLQKALDVLRENKSTFKFTNSTLNKLEKIDKKLIELYDKVLLDSVIYLIITETRKDYKKGKNETQEQLYERVSKQSKALYEKLLVVFQKARHYTREVVTKIEERSVQK